jgi:hypothetical protein
MNTQVGMLLVFVSVTLFSCTSREKRLPTIKDLPAWEKEMDNKLFPPTPAKPVFYISGMYVLIDLANFCTTWDTIWVSKKPMEVNSYRVRRKTVFKRGVGEKLFPMECYQQSWTGSYDASARKMEALTEAHELQVNEAQNGVELEGNSYKKIE